MNVLIFDVTSALFLYDSMLRILIRTNVCLQLNFSAQKRNARCAILSVGFYYVDVRIHCKVE